MAGYVTASITAQNTFTDWIKPKKQYASGANVPGHLDLLVGGTWVGTVTVQKKHVHNGVSTDTFDLPDTYTANTCQIIEDYSDSAWFRVGIATGDYTSGTCELRLEK